MKKNTLFNILLIIVVIALGILVTVSFKKNADYEKEILSLKEQNTSVIDKYKEIDELGIEVQTIMLEGIEEKIVTKKYNSSLGYSISYDVATYSVWQENNYDIYYVNESSYISICHIDEMPDLDEIAQIGEHTYFFEYENKDDVHYGKYYIQKGNNNFLITVVFPDESEYYAGIGIRNNYLLETIKFD